MVRKLRIQWIEDKKRRQAAYRKRRATLLEKARELAILCDVAVAVVVYGYGEAEPTTWPSGASEVKDVLQRYVNMPDIAKGNMNIESFLRERIAKVKRTLENLKRGNSSRNADLVLNEISLRRRHSLDDLTPEVVAAVKSSYVARMNLVDRCIKFPLSQATAAVVPPPPPVDDALVPVPQEPLVVAPLVMDSVVADALLSSPPADAALVPVPQELLVSPPLEMETVVAPPLAIAPVVADARSPLLPMDELDDEPRHGSFVKEMAEAILDDGTGSNVVPTAADVERILKQHGLFKPQ